MKKWYVTLVMFVLSLLLLASLWIRQEYMTPAVESMTFFESTSALERLFTSEAAVNQRDVINVVYFWQNHCPCDQFVKPHFLLMMEAYQQVHQHHYLEQNKVSPKKQSPQFYLAVLDDSLASLADSIHGINLLPDTLLKAVKHEVIATPSVAIWDANNQLVYFGPHSLGYVCNDDTSLVKKVVDALIDHRPVTVSTMMGDGCFCSTMTTKS